MEKSWYVIHTYSGYEGRVKASLEERVKALGIEDKVGKVLIPTEEVVEIKEGKKRVSTKKFFPGYVLVEMSLDEELQQLVKSTPKVTGFLGGGATPSPLSRHEVDVLLKQIDEGVAQPREKTQFDKGDNVRIIDGPFLGFNGVVDEVNTDQSKVKVLVSIFGRSTPVELSFLQVERV
ncbi:MAG TPA: transcription termination/antitermination protein NusG [Candidatus Manganitrophaceae bacterium]|nr:transcription termination/antitermination protein NusG [Candidatus Manganitrophaceae bacterium]